MQNSLGPKKSLFTNQMLFRLIWPLILEQFLAVTVGMADTLMVASVGATAVSGISLVDQINILLIQVFAALATGGAVVSSQYLGRRDHKNASRSAKQLFYLTLIIATAVGFFAVLLNRHILQAVFGNVEPAVMQAAETYFWLSALSYPFLGIYNAGAALFRSMGNSKISLATSLIMNVINIAGNAILIFGFGMGVAGAAIASLFSRAVAALIMVVLLRNPQNPICLVRLHKPEFSKAIIGGMLRVGVPTGIENGVFQVGKLLVAGLISSFGTMSIAANAIANNLAGICNVPGAAIGLAMITVIGQNVGAKDIAQARIDTRKLMLFAYAGVGILSMVIFFATPFLSGFYQFDAPTTELAVDILRFSCICTVVIWPMSFSLPNALRAAGDAKYTMVVSMASMWIFRIAMSYVLGRFFGMGLFGVWAAMVLDWAVRSIFFFVRFQGKKWETKKVLSS